MKRLVGCLEYLCPRNQLGKHLILESRLSLSDVRSSLNSLSSDLVDIALSSLAPVVPNNSLKSKFLILINFNNLTLVN
jgi:hypothetical protein